jgi:2-methylcitrate dehydratase
VALLDREVTPAQYNLERIRRSDVQALLRRVTVRPAPEFSAAFPREVPCRVTVYLRTGETLFREKRSYPGSLNSPLPWAAVEEKFHRLAEGCADRQLRDAIVSALANLERIQISELTAILGRVKGPPAGRKAA